ncbi:MAG: hypothetical protein JNL25_15460 [Rhodospirillaceae bacterium]|nr:hypothetical protein [Rhodospirillaceae bacterium]
MKYPAASALGGRGVAIAAGWQLIHRGDATTPYRILDRVWVSRRFGKGCRDNDGQQQAGGTQQGADASEFGLPHDRPNLLPI